ncbi:MAG: hypothetical protein A2312_03165 [Candidatus Staskawiczbacteria bacterium RIFOXYB2_FULL_32_9]|uniref:Uncharacterized protein n=1 Tax=Candidatus Staskawiczbacteria bacterium RIFOXYD1_FULL_32_13 TaxID=1802234 RepID=A0A1G2JNA5_9BACT|nr:MAG: hypothetical protein UR22_C0005G0022 [Parcubacteria group bacterium GW2011_GWC2_32_10]OGZ79674.1 MAG: hypothetical protein A2360_01975 [Candidatus Staskawiczbacteria bacterium RIFOXYB1_FULL_32_11]OGZ81076.1 MAG: hypothetical protein A2256_03225 [Candidatus Staskawiczbacteria bacterium RIFOXYA2_FULL_32_7]OGZ81142.1 MAG: hypothetical protein A2312_03165 [Candidatus Staskawiczbacteria bacterium RIFOXYB2_FULL_32_9]OGZ85504.1 MAG: hypothetical protein A2463_02400 [Candidatus Staskawiczbacter
MGYWDATDNFLAGSGGRGPRCPACGEEMFPEDDHGRFICFCGGRGKTHDVVSGETREIPRIPQVELPEGVTDLPDEEKRSIHPLNRLHLPPTAEERDFFAQALRELRGEFGDES